MFIGIGLNEKSYSHEASAMIAGFACWSLAKTILMPGQIYEIHDYMLDVEQSMKTDMIASKFDRQKHELQADVV